MLYPEIMQLIKTAKENFDAIPAERKKALQKLAHYIQQRLADRKKILLTFICTHNSRRSHFAQIWAQVAAAYYQLPDVFCYSGGTEVTAFNSNAVKALQDVGFQIISSSAASNPHYEVQFSGEIPPVKAFSKKYADAPNPTKDYAAVLTCTNADESCPVVLGANERIKIAYDDPKLADGTPQQEAIYQQRSIQIATEILYAFSMVK